MENAAGDRDDGTKCSSCGERRRLPPKSKKRELAFSCMLNTEVGALLAVIRRPMDPTQYLPDDTVDYSIVQSLKSLRAYIFSPQQEWHTTDPSIYLSAFLDVIQTGGVPAAATSVALHATLKIFKLSIFDEKTPGAGDAINSAVSAVSQCHLERTDPAFEDSVRMTLLQVLVGIMKHPSSVLLTENAAANVVESCYNVFKSASKGDLLQRSAIYTMHELIQTIFARLPEIEVKEGEENPDSEDDLDLVLTDSGSNYGVNCAVYIFELLCKLLNVAEVVETEGAQSLSVDEDVQAFALVLINNAIEMSGEGIGKHPKLLRIIQDRLFHHLIHYGTRSSPLILSMITSTVLNIYYFLRRYIRVQLEAFFVHVLFRVTSMKGVIQQQEVAVEGVINFCRQPTFLMEVYVNYDCDPIARNVLEEIGKLLCKYAFPVGGPLSPLQVQAFEGLVIMINNIAEGMEKMDKTRPLQTYPVDITEYRPYWVEKPREDLDSWVEYVRLRKAQKKKLLVAANHFNRDEKKGLEYLKLCNLVSDPMDPKAYAYFFRFAPGLNKNAIGDYLGDPDEFHVQVLKEFTETFQFTGMTLDGALRTYLETFKMPGEAQKITRVLEALAERYFNQQASEIFANKDAMFVMCYSLIMLNTDLHNPQVKKKMTEEEFIKNCRAINDGKDLPRDYLSDLFYNIATNEIKLKDQSQVTVGMNPGQWFDLQNRSKVMLPFMLCDFEQSLGRDMFAAIAGPSVAALCALFEHTDEDDILNECIEGMFSVAKIAQHGLEDTLDELLAAFCKFTTLLNPYASAEETLFAFSHDLKPRMATLAVFAIANNFGDSIRGGWRNVVDCLLKLRKLKLLPQSIIDPDPVSASSSSSSSSQDSKNMINKISSHFLTMDNMEDSLPLGTEFEQNLKVIKQCRIGSIFYNSTSLPDSAVINLGRCLIFAAAGKGQKFSTPVEEEDTVVFCWDLVVAISSSNAHRFQNFWPSFHEFLITVVQFPLFSPVPFAEKAILALLKICLSVIAAYRGDKLPEELIFKSINLMRKLDKDIMDTCSEFIMQTSCKILIQYPLNVQTQIGWKSLLDFLEFTGRIPQTNEQGVEALINLLSNANHLTRLNYAFCINCASSFIGLRVTPLDKNLKIMDLMAESVNLLIQWSKNGGSEQAPAMSYTSVSVTSSVSLDDPLKSFTGSNFTLNLFVKLGEAIKKASLSRREEVRNQAVLALHKSFTLAQELDFTSTNCINCFNLVLFAMVDDLHEKMLQYSRRDNSQREMRSMEGTLKIAMEVVTDVFLQFLKEISKNPGFRTFWLGVLRRMDTCMKADLGEHGQSEVLQELVPDLLTKMITKMKEEEILVKKEDDDDDLWEITYIQIQWIAPSLKDELFLDD